MTAVITHEVPRIENRPYQPYGAAKKLFYGKHEEMLIEGPAGTGKTRAVLEKMHLCAEKYPTCRILLVRKTRESMTESVLVTFEAKVGQAEHEALRGAGRNFRQIYKYENGSEIVIGGLDKVEKIMSTEYDIICVFEATEITEDEWEKLQTRLRNHVIPYQQAIADCNPSGPAHWLNMRASTDLMTRLVSRHEDNPTVTPDYIATLDRLTGVRYLRLRKGLWAAAEGLVYDNYDPAIHVVEPFDIPEDWRKIRVIDFGYTNPFVCQWWAIDHDGRMYLYREIYETKTLVEDQAKRIVALSNGMTPEANIADHDAEDRATLDKYGIPTLPAYKAITVGIEAVQARLRDAGDGKPRLFVFQNCLVQRDEKLVAAKKPYCTEQEWEGYVWPKEKDGRAIKEVPVAVDDHGLDALRYAVAYVDNINVPKLDVHLLGQDRIRHERNDQTFDERVWH